MNLYEKFRKLLDQNGITPYRIHKETGISTATLSDWKNGKSEPKKDKLLKICNYFNVPLSYFYGEEPVENEEPQIHTIAAHFDGSEYTELELDKIKEFAEFVKNNRKK